MPGLSLWLVPREGNPFTKTVQELINDEVPRQFYLPDGKVHSFIPHVTVTSEIDVKIADAPQEWLDKLEFPNFKKEHNEVLIELDHIQAEDPFFRKCNIAVSEDANLRTTCAIARKAAGLSEEFARDPKQYRPHMSLLYADIPTEDVKKKVPLIETKFGFAVGDIFACCGGSLSLGGELVLVDTTKPIEEWNIIAKRDTPWAVWKASRTLL
jgi:2'-5' RNA ligase